MKRISTNGLSLWQFPLLSQQPSIRHFISDRHSNENGDDFTLSFSSLPDRDVIRTNRSRVAEAMGIEPGRLVFPSQVHQTKVVYVTDVTPREELMETDALITDHANICVAVMSADCVPILIYDRRNQAVAAIHSGWKGTVARIVDKTLQRMKDSFGTRGENILAAIGPSVCQESYEVGEEVVASVNNVFGKDSALMIPQPNNKAKLDLWKANKLQLLEFGVSESDIEISNLCTVKNNEYFFSARKGDKGRFAAGIMIKA